jgi:glycosyltransferase involved in cell wall biosynthesis
MPTSSGHIAHVLPWSTIGGTELATLRLAQAVGNEDFTHTAFCQQADSPVSELFNSAGFDTARFEPIEPSYKHPSAYLRASIRLAREFRRRRVDLVHCSDLLSAYYAGLAGKLARLPVLCHVRCAYPEISRRDQSFLKVVNHFAFVSNDAWQSFAFKVPVGRATVIYDGIDIKQVTDNLDQSVREEFKVPEGARIVGMIARVAPAKDFATLIQAAKRVISKFPDTRFLIVGDYSQVQINRDHFNEIQSRIAAAGLLHNFIFTDHRNDVDRLLAAMDLFVLSTKTEGLPLVILEAMAQGKAVLATAVGGVPELIIDGETGLLHGPGDDEQLATQILSLFEDNVRRKLLGEAGREAVKMNFTRKQFGRRMAELYGQMIGRPQLIAPDFQTGNERSEMIS